MTALALLFAGVVVHELLHAWTWRLFGHVQHVTFGIRWQGPYAHCDEAMTCTAYRLGAIAPVLVLGVAPIVAGLLLGVPDVTRFGIVFAVAGAGDLQAVGRTWGIPSEAIVRDSPDAIGCTVVFARRP